MINNKKSLYITIFNISLPIALENMIYSLINFIDIFMIGAIGIEAINAIGISNQIFFIFSCSIFGLLSGSNILSAQYFGEKNYKNLKKIVFINMCIGIVLSLPFLVAILLFPRYISLYYTNNALVIKYILDYIIIIVFTFPLFALGFSLSMVLRAVNMSKYSFYASIYSLIINASLNFILIPKLGVSGAAIATLIARLFNLIYLIYIILKNNVKILPDIKTVKRIEIGFVKKTLSISLLTFIHEFMWVLALNVKVMLYGKMGIEAFSSIQVVESINKILFTLIVGLTNATAVIVGNEIGRKNFKGAYEYSKECMKVCVVMLFFVLLGFNIFSPLLMKIMKVDSIIYPIVRKLIYSQTIVTILTSFSWMYLVGILRAGGDIIYSMVIEAVFVWFVGIPLTYVAIKIFNLPVHIVYVLAWLDDLIKLIPCTFRYRSKKWIKRKI